MYINKLITLCGIQKNKTVQQSPREDRKRERGGAYRESLASKHDLLCSYKEINFEKVSLNSLM